MVVALRVPVFLAVLSSLVAGVAGGLLRAGVALPSAGAAWLGPAAAAHAFLMICGFMGTVIAVERAVAVKRRAAWAAPAASAMAGLLMLAGAPQAAAWLALLAALAFAAVNRVVWQRQRATHTALLIAGAFAWLVGNLLFALGARIDAVVPWWFCLLVLTIAAERLEMTRLMRRRAGALVSLVVALGGMLLGAALFSLSPRWGAAVFGLALLALALWLMRHDIARRTILAHGLSRYMAACLLLGYGWLALSGAAWLATAAGLPGRDAALHALALGFVFSMMLGHAPVILPALMRVKLAFGWPFYIALAVLQVSLATRLFWGLADAGARSWGAAGNAVAMLLFALTLAGSAITWRIRHGRPARWSAT